MLKDYYLKKYDELKRTLSYRYDYRYFTVEDLMQELYIEIIDMEDTLEKPFGFLLTLASHLHYDMTAKICGVTRKGGRNKKRSYKINVYKDNFDFRKLKCTITPETILMKLEKENSVPFLIERAKNKIESLIGFNKDVVRLFINETSIPDIADQLDMHEQGVRTQLALGINNLYEAFKTCS